MMQVVQITVTVRKDRPLQVERYLEVRPKVGTGLISTGDAELRDEPDRGAWHGTAKIQLRQARSPVRLQ